jgi:hypothetical protein
MVTIFRNSNLLFAFIKIKLNNLGLLFGLNDFFLKSKLLQSIIISNIQGNNNTNNGLVKKLLKLTISIFFTLLTAKTYSQPNPITVESVPLYIHTTNSSDLVGPVAAEATDYVTIGSTTKYYVMPYQATNPLFNAAIDLFANVVSTFTWTVTPALSTAGAVATTGAYSGAPHYKQIVWTGLGSGNIQVREKSNLGCDGNIISTPVEVILAPTVQFSSTSNGDCSSAADGSVHYSITGGLPISWTSSVTGTKLLKVNYTINCTNVGFGGIQTHNNVTVTETGAGTGTFDISFLERFGIYTITLTAINDRISKKSGINGTLSGSSVYTFVLSPTPASGNVYHRANE